eukprot:9498411-Pyramimonas_sp.AAC.1
MVRSMLGLRSWNGASGASTLSERAAGLPASCRSWAQAASAVSAAKRVCILLPMGLRVPGGG